jgi:hypothetical protein
VAFEVGAVLAARPVQLKLDGLSVYIFSMANFENRDLMNLVIDEIDDSVLTLPYPIAISVSREFLGTFRAGVRAQCLNSLNNTLTISFCA